MNKNITSTKLGHHHGDLKQALIKAGMTLLQQGGMEALTLRKCAAQAGVSHAAPAHHFKGLKGLKTAILTQGHKSFTTYMLRGIKAADDDPKSKLIGCCNGYIKFNEENPALGSMLFVNENCFTDNVEWQKASTASYQVLVDVAKPFQTGVKGRALNEVAIWTMLEGYCNFMRWGKLNNIPHVTQPIEFEDLLEMLKLQVKP